MSIEKKLLSMYIPEHEVEVIIEERRTSLRRYIQMIGMNWKTMSQEQIDKVADSQGYQDFRKIRRIKYAQRPQRKTGIYEDGNPFAPNEYEPSKRYKHLNPAHIARQQLYSKLVSSGHSAYKTPPLFHSTGPKGYLARHPESTITFKKMGMGKSGKPIAVSQITKKTLKKQREYRGGSAVLPTTAMENVQSFVESDKLTSKKIPKMNNNIKEIKQKDEKHCEKEFEIKKTITGETNDTNNIQINPVTNKIK